MTEPPAEHPAAGARPGSPPVQPSVWSAAGATPGAIDPTAGPDAAGPDVPAGSPPVPDREWPPAPPSGPGVQVAFPAPPAERDKRRMWIGIGVGTALALVCCIGGIFGFGALIVSSQAATANEAKSAVSRYLDGLRDRDFAKAYDQLCQDITEHESLREFAARRAGQPRIAGYRLASTQVRNADIEVTADIRFVDGQAGRALFSVVPGQSVGTLKVCGVTQ